MAVWAGNTIYSLVGISFLIDDNHIFYCKGKILLSNHKNLMMKRILVPTDFSYCANNATDFAVQSAKIFNAEITLLHSFEV